MTFGFSNTPNFVDKFLAFKEIFKFFPNTSAPLNIFEPRYIQMIDDSMKSDRIIGMIQPKKSGDTKNLIYLKLDVWEKLQVLMRLMMVGIQLS